MHRMHHRRAKAGLFLLLASIVRVSIASADVIRPERLGEAPVITGAIAGRLEIEHDAARGITRLRATTTPYLLTDPLGTTPEASIRPAEDGVRSETIRLRLDEAGRLMDDRENAFTVRGTVMYGGQSYRGVLLTGTPIAYQADGTLTRALELNVAITGGALAHLFGPQVYIRLRTADEPAGRPQRFSSTVLEASTVGLQPAGRPITPLAEPTALAILLASGWWLLIHYRAQAPRPMAWRGNSKRFGTQGTLGL